MADPVRSGSAWTDIKALMAMSGAEIEDGRDEIRPAPPARSGGTAMSMMHYKGYEALVEYDEDAELFHGEVLNLRDVITFQGSSVDELKRALAGSVEDYLAFCAKRGEEPERPYSGQFVVRIEPGLHRAVMSAARRAGISLNKWVARTLERATA